MAVINQVTISNGGTTSPAQPALPTSPAQSLLIMAPAALTGTVSVEVAPVAGGTYRTLQSNGADVTIAAGKATQITVLCGCAWRLKSGSAEGADRTFDIVQNAINGQWGAP